ncbi:MAG: hypothetical protein MJB12_01495 [Firmicutes bacterium]|nr:hypothetical protein [Bacillota bacterium]
MKRKVFEIILNGILLIVFIGGIIYEIINWIPGAIAIVFIVPSIAIFLSTWIFRNKYRFANSIFYYLICLIVPFTLSLIGSILVTVICQYQKGFNLVFDPVLLMLYAIPSVIVLLLSFIYNKYISDRIE